ncbi:hypothetical protein IKG33_02310 [Candidatus Saccharibacteria bacterium]|nr:hypothetical protein [Candidatus Saccharibacteria bacterium]
MAREINLVPDIKGEMIKTLKLRNFIFFLCIVVACASVGVTLFFGLIVGGQQMALDGKKATLNTLSDKLNSYSDLNDFLTIKDQLGDISTLSNNKKVLSRTFDILSALIPTGADTITISELNVNLASEQPTFTFDAQANAGKEPFIDYNVLDAFKKSMQYMRYDYGNYVDKEGNIIPAYCMIESGSDGSLFNDGANNIYAFWTIDADGCNPAKSNTDSNESNKESTDNSDKKAESNTEEKSSTSDGYTREDYEGQQVVRIWRTPQFKEWYKETQTKGKPYMSLDGAISGVPHFESACIKYTGEKSSDKADIKWGYLNENCLLVPAGVDGISISDSSNGRGASDELVLRFSATIALNPAVYSFANHHVIAIPPSGRHNVTDSYVQIQAMFGERAADCDPNDSACNSSTNSGEDGSNSDSGSNNSNTNDGTNGGKQNG